MEEVPVDVCNALALFKLVPFQSEKECPNVPL